MLDIARAVDAALVRLPISYEPKKELDLIARGIVMLNCEWAEIKASADTAKAREFAYSVQCLFPIQSVERGVEIKFVHWKKLQLAAEKLLNSFTTRATELKADYKLIFRVDRL